MNTATSPTPRTKTHYPALDGVRGLAIILVMLVHFTPDSHVRANRILEWMYKLARSGWVGVDLFFVLSGFLITGILLDTRGDARYYINFYMRRTLRVFPLYYGVLLVVFGIVAHVPSLRPAGMQPLEDSQLWFWLYATNIGLAVPGVLGAWKAGVIWLIHFWSLAVEEQFYLVWPAVVRRMRLDTLKKACWGIIFGVFAVRTAMTLFYPELITPYYAFRFDALAAGCLLAVMFKQEGGKAFFIRHRHLIWLAGMLVLATHMYLAKGLWPTSVFMSTVGFSMVACVAAATLAIALEADPAGLAGRIWSHQALRFMGKYSYGIYVYHVFVMAISAVVVPPQSFIHFFPHPVIGDAVLVLSSSVVSVGLAFLSFHLYEKHFLKAKKHFEPALASTDAR